MIHAHTLPGQPAQPPVNRMAHDHDMTQPHGGPVCSDQDMTQPHGGVLGLDHTTEGDVYSQSMMPGDASQALAVKKFVVPRVPVRHLKVAGVQGKGGNKAPPATQPPTTGYIVTQPPGTAAAPSSMVNLTIDIPPSPPPRLIHLKNIRPFTSAQNTPKSLHHGAAGGITLNSVVIGNTDIICGQNAGRKSRLLKRSSVEVLPDFPLADLVEALGTGSTQEANKGRQNRQQGLQYRLVSAGDPSSSSRQHTPDNLTQILSHSATDRHGSGPVTTGSSDPHRAVLRSASSDPHLASTTTDAIVGGDPPVGGMLLTMPQGRSNSCADPMISMCDRDLNSPLMFHHMGLQHGAYDTGLTLEEIQRETVAMETGQYNISPWQQVNTISHHGNRSVQYLTMVTG